MGTCNCHRRSLHRRDRSGRSRPSGVRSGTAHWPSGLCCKRSMSRNLTRRQVLGGPGLTVDLDGRCASTLALLSTPGAAQGAGGRYRDGPGPDDIQVEGGRRRCGAPPSPSPTSSAPKTRSVTWDLVTALQLDTKLDGILRRCLPEHSRTPASRFLAIDRPTK